MWTDGTDVVNGNWSSGEPDDQGPGSNSGCDHMVWVKGQWQDRNKLDKNNYICQYEAKSGKRRKRSTEAADMDQILLGGCAKQRKKREGKILIKLLHDFNSC